MELYHLPGAVNVLADVLSRAIADNLNNKMPKEHPISKQWAKVLPPIPENFGVDHGTLYKFLTRPLQTEPQDTYNRELRKLMEPKSVFTMYKESQSQTPEQKFHSAQVLLHQWFSEYAKKHREPEPHVAQLFHAKMQLDLQTQQICMEKIQDIMEKLYSDIKSTPLYKTLQKNLQEVSERYLLCLKNPLTESLLGKLKESQKKLLSTSQLITNTELENQTNTVLKINFINAVSDKEPESSNPIVYYSLHPEAKILPKICNASNGLDIPLQEDVHFTPYEIKKVNLKIKFQFPRNHCALLMNKSSARTKYDINVQLGLIDVGYHDYVIAVLQNMRDKPNILYSCTAVAQLLLLPAKIPEFRDEWPHTDSERGSFGSTGQDFAQKISTNYMQYISNLENLLHAERASIGNCQFSLIQKSYESCPLMEIKAALSPECIKINNMKIHLIQDGHDNTQEIYDFQELENYTLDKISPYIMTRLPSYQVTLGSKETSTQETNTAEKENETRLFPKHYTVPITSDDLSQLLAADLLMNKKLTLDTLIYLQNSDPHIAYLKDAMLNSKPIRKFSLKKGVICKTSKNAAGVENLVIYLPSVLLYPVMVYIHKYFLHCSKSQTLVQFQEMYFHPQEKKAALKISNACLVCALSRNPEYRLIPVGKERTINPTKPRQAISMDILYMPRSAKGHTHALLIADLFSMYLSFYPLKSKTSGAIASALRLYISTQGVPKVVYSDNDPSFRDEVETLLTSYSIQHCTGYPYNQQNNSVEAQVRKFKNAARAAILDNPLTNHTEWCNLFPLVIVRLNSMVSKYGASRELIHFQDILETQLPLITEFKCHEELQKDIEFGAKKFKKIIGKFMANKAQSKHMYKKGIATPYLLHELVMRKVHNPATALHPTFAGPVRILEIHPQGALIKDTRTGEIMSAHYKNLRKLTADEFLTLLPNNFDADILKNMGMYRYNKNHLPDPIEQTLSTEDKEYMENLMQKENTEENKEDDLHKKDVTFSGKNERILRSGKKISINTYTLPPKYKDQAIYSFWSYTYENKKRNKTNSCLTRSLTTDRTPNADMEQYFEEDCYLFYSTTRKIPRPEDHYKSKYRSSFNSPLPGYLYIKMDTAPKSAKKVRFDQIIVKFY